MSAPSDKTILLATLVACALLGGGTFLFLTRNQHSHPTPTVIPTPVRVENSFTTTPPPPKATITPQQQMFDAAARGDVRKVNDLIFEHPELVNETNGNVYGSTPMHFAAYGGRDVVISTLLGHGGNVNARNKAGLTPLMDAAGNGKKQAVWILLANGADPNLRDPIGRTALDFARMKNWTEVAALLESRTEAPPVSPATADAHSIARKISAAADKGDFLAVSNLLSAHPEFINTKLGNAYGSTPLIEASYFGRESAVAWLLAHGADVNALNNRRWTALMLAAKNGHAGVVRQLLAHHADPGIVNLDGDTALAFAQASNRVEIVTQLEAHTKQPPPALSPELK